MTRTSAEIGAGLAPVRAARPITPGERIHVVGAGGAGASGAALLAHAAGAIVSGCDSGGPSPYTAAIAATGIKLAWSHDPAHVSATPSPDRLAVTKALTAIAPDHPELRAASALGIPVEAWQQVVADAAVGRRMVAVAGTHGKSTSAGWLTHILASAGSDPSAFVGALLPPLITGSLPATARIGRGRVFVVEADEYAGNFDPYRPAVALLTSVEWDHPDVFADRGAVVGAFEAWVRRMPPAAVLVANVADGGVATLVERLADWPGQLIATAVVDEARQRLGGFIRGMGERFRTAGGPTSVLIARVAHEPAQGTAIEILGLDPLSGPFPVALPTVGRHNVANALGVAGAAQALGLDQAAIGTGLATFPGMGRRLELKGEVAGVVIYDDYGHHPTAIRVTLAALRQREPGRRIWAVYEPLTYHRTAALLGDFAVALSAADGVAIADVWAGRDPDTTIVSAEVLAGAVRRLRPELVVAAPGSVEATADWLAMQVRAGDAVLVMGGGRSYRIAERLVAALGGRGGG